MVLGLITIKFYLSWVNTIKEKRSEITSIISKISKKFNVSVIESGLQDYHQSSEIAIAFLAGNIGQGDSIKENIINYIESNFDAEITDIASEFR